MKSLSDNFKEVFSSEINKAGSFFYVTVHGFVWDQINHLCKGSHGAVL